MNNVINRWFVVAVVLLGGVNACSNATDESGFEGNPMYTVETRQGKLQGTASGYDESIRVFRGVPYAMPPVGDRRWRPPEMAESWQGVRDATRFSAACFQQTNTSAFVWRRGEFPVSEDCLYLNIWAPADARGLPIMVWFHGGAHTSGQGHAKIFDGTTLARHGVIVVTINYRLGPFGFLAHPWLAGESDHDSAGNYGLLDKIAALDWVQQNITAFGGDAGNVTVFGQSAGSQSICSLMTSPLARGLFRKAIGQSAACVGPAPAKDADGRERGSRLVEQLGVRDLAALRAAEPSALLDASDKSGWSADSRIVIDGWVLPEAPVEAFRQGRQLQIPLMAGSLSNEGIMLFPMNPELTEVELDRFLKRQVGDLADSLKRLYRAEHESAGAVQHAVATDMFMAFGMRRWAEYNAAAGNPTFLYFMDHAPPAFHLYTPEDPELEVEGGPRSAGAYHSGDLAYVFGNTDKVGLHWRAEDHALSTTMVNYWTNFARTGDPNGEVLPAWEPFTLDNYETLLLNESPGTVNGVRREKLDLLGKALPR